MNIERLIRDICKDNQLQIEANTFANCIQISIYNEDFTCTILSQKHYTEEATVEEWDKLWNQILMEIINTGMGVLCSSKKKPIPYPNKAYYYTPGISEFVDGFKYQEKHNGGIGIVDFANPKESKLPEVKDYWVDKTYKKVTAGWKTEKSDELEVTFTVLPQDILYGEKLLKQKIKNGYIRAKVTVSDIRGHVYSCVCNKCLAIKVNTTGELKYNPYG